MSRYAEILLLSIERLESSKMHKFAKEEMLTNALAEADMLKPHLRVLNAEKKKSAPKTPMKRMLQEQEVGKSLKEIECATEVVYDWLKQPDSMLRSLLAFLAQDGLFFSSYCASRVAEAWVKEKPTTLTEAKEATVARICGDRAKTMPSASGVLESDKLFLDHQRLHKILDYSEQ